MQLLYSIRCIVHATININCLKLTHGMVYENYVLRGIVTDVKFWDVVTGRYSPGFFGHWGCRKIRPRNAPALAPNGLKFNCDALA